MGFWSSFLGAGAAHVYNEMKKEERETQKWNDLLHEMMECESAFNDYLKNVGIVDSYCADVEYVNSGNISPIKREISALRKKVDNYLSLGGLGVCVRNLESLDDDIEKVKYLKKIGQLERQVEFAYDDMYTVQEKIKTEQEEIEYQKGQLREIQKEQYGKETDVSIDISSMSESSILHVSIERILDGRIRTLFSEKWNEFIEDYYTFDACLDDLFQATNLREKINVLDTIISGYKLYEAYLMASKMPYNLQMEMFKEIIDIMNIGEYERDKAEGIYLEMLSNENGFRNHIEITVLPTEDYAAGMFWTHLLAACDGIVDYSYIENLLNYHVAYLVALGTSVQCFVDDDILEDVTINYCGEVHALLNRYIEAKTL